MVSAYHLVAIGYICARPKEQSPVGMHVLKGPIIAVRHHLDVLGGNIVGDGQHFVIGVAQDHLAIVFPAGASSLFGWKNFENALDLDQGFFGQPLRIREQDR